MNIYGYLKEQGYKIYSFDAKTKHFGKGKDISSIVPCALAQYLIKGDSMFLYGLGVVGFPPMLLSPLHPDWSKDGLKELTQTFSDENNQLVTKTIQCVSEPQEIISNRLIDAMDVQDAFNLLYPLSISKDFLKSCTFYDNI